MMSGQHRQERDTDEERCPPMKFWLHQDTGPRDQQEDAIHADESGLAIVCDGMGGHRAGDVASAMALEAFVEAIEEGFEPGEALEEAVANLRAASCDRPEVRGMGTTLTAVVVNETLGEASVIHVGDSRLYHLPSPFAGAATQLTEDHGYGNMLARFLPDEAHPDLFTFDVTCGDRIMLCSDGVYNYYGSVNGS